MMTSTRTRRRLGATDELGEASHICTVGLEQDLRAALAGALGCRAIAHWSHFDHGAEFLGAAGGLQIDCAIIAEPLGDMDVLAIVSWLAEQRPEASSIVLSVGNSVPLAVACMKAGTSDFLLLPLEADTCAKAIGAALEPAPRRVTRQMAVERRMIAAKLSQREIQVLEGLVAGYSNKELGEKLEISERTVEVHRSRIMRRLDAESFAELVIMAARAGLAGG
jgi:two-component system response regulator FixJ